MLFALLGAVVLVATGTACQFSFFRNSDTLVCVITFFLFSLAMMGAALLLSTCLSNGKRVCCASIRVASAIS